uniref:Uncharacterized protein n=1 Tax=Cacopsylla melanoneura TaxID=428564 RepID=A0A8D8Q4X9_9HEMI
MRCNVVKSHIGGTLGELSVLRMFFTFLTILLSGSFDVKYDNKRSNIGMYSFNSRNFLSWGDIVMVAAFESFFEFSSFAEELSLSFFPCSTVVLLTSILEFMND